MIALFDDEDLLVELAGNPFGEDGAGKAAADDDVGIVMEVHDAR
jgi:hypothetical protein